MYDITKPLDFNEIDDVMSDLTYINAVYNHEEGGMSWDDIRRIFPDNGPLMEARYKAENRRD